MNHFQGTNLFRVMVVLFGILGLYAMNYLVAPGGLTLLGFQEWVLPSLLRSSSQKQLPTSMIIYPSLAAPPNVTNSTALLLEDKTMGKTIELEENEGVMVTPSTSNLKDLVQPVLKEGFPVEFPGAKNVSNNNKQELDGEWSRSSRKEGLNFQGDNDPQQGAIQGSGVEGGVEEQNEGEKVLKGGGEKNETVGVEMPLLSSSSTLPPPPPYNGTFKGGNMQLWLPRVAALLSKCASTGPISILEYLAQKPCPRNCSGNGVCNHDSAKCRCFHGYTGAACDLYKDFECNMKYSSNMVEQQGIFGPRILSICPATCDKRKGFCYCGENTKYPERPTTEQCGFHKILGTGFTYNWTIGDPAIYTKDNSTPGWCNVDPAEYYTGTMLKKEDCFCLYDGIAGELCEYPTESTCVNQCSGNGLCRNGFCACEEGWYGIDCSIPSAKASVQTWPSWISSDMHNSHQPGSGVEYQESKKISVQRHRPLIYIYDLPAQFNNLLLEGRHFKFHCVNRVYGPNNWTIWAEALYGAENAFLESLLASKHRTNNAQEADFFYVPVLGACAIARAGDSPHMDIHRKHYGIRPYFAGDVYYKKAYQHIRKAYPYWDRYKGRDHIWMFPWDEGACVCPKEIWNSMMLVHWGNTNSKYKDSTTAYGADNWNIVPKYWRGNHPCYDPEKDIVLPSWKNPDRYLLDRRLWTRNIDQRPTLFYFRGNLGSKYNSGRPELKYSMGIRQRVAEEFGTEPNLEGQVGRRFAPDVKVVNGRTENYSLELASSRFCGVFPGDGWSGRLEDSILHGCIPVIIQDGIDLPFENVLDYSKFTVRIAEGHLPLTLDILRSIPEEQVWKMQSVVQTLWQRFTYHNAIRLEADRQKASGNKSRFRSWTQFKDLTDDDAFDTFIQVPHSVWMLYWYNTWV